jgi:FixJ family two-component response regulator
MTLAHALVFVIDDEMSMRKAIGRLLESEGYSVEMFTGAREFLARPPHGGPSCVVVDLNMPELNGLDLQRALAESGRVEQLIFITGGASVPTCLQAMKAGAIDYLSKPFRDEDLLSAVEQALVRASEERVKSSQHKEARARLATLTPREFDVRHAQQVLALTSFRFKQRRSSPSARPDTLLLAAQSGPRLRMRSRDRLSPTHCRLRTSTTSS